MTLFEDLTSHFAGCKEVKATPVAHGSGRLLQREQWI